MLVQGKNNADQARNRAERGGIASSSSSAMFEKVLRAFELGDLDLSDVQSSLMRMLKDGASPEELLRVLRRRESIEPLPEDARDKIVATLREAKPTSALESGTVVELPAPAAAHASLPATTDEEPDTSAMSRLIEEFNAAWDTEPEVRPAPAPATREIAAQNVDYTALRHALRQREDDFDALQAEHSRVLGLLEARARSVAQLQEELREISGLLQASRGEVQLQQSKTAEVEEALEQMRRTLAERDAAMEQMNRALAGRDGVIEQARELLAQRNAQIAALQGENAQPAPTVESGAQLAAKLQEERDAAIEAQKQHHAKIVGALMARAKATETELKAARERIEELASELQSRDLAPIDDLESIADLEPAADLQPVVDLQAVAELQPAAELRQDAHVAEELEHTLPLQPRFQSPPPLLEMRRDFEIGDFSPPPPRTRAPTGKPNSTARIVGICAAIVVLAIIGWVALRHVPAAKSPAAAAASLPTPGTVIRDCPTCPSFTVLPTGRFKQGSAESNSSEAVKPLHWVTIGYPLAMSTSAVTVDQFRAFITATGRDMHGCDTYDGRWKHQPKNSWQNPGFEQAGTHPVTCVSWSDATAYAQWLSQQTGHRYRLPSASEWEYAARVGGNAVQPWSANGSDACANANVADSSAARRFPGWVAFACNDGYVFTAPVGSFKANAFGLNDMLGNVFQWTEDCWNANYKDAPIDGSARTGGNCSERELRGGSWFSSPGYVRADYRNHFSAGYRTSTVGIRLVRDITP
jgi:formylglycine-generating enzyme required for sulfatase activity